jgi:YD repeat-containing protein
MIRSLQRLLATGVAWLLLVPAALGAGPVSYSYDALHRLTAVSYPDGSQIQYSYDPAGNMTQKRLAIVLDPDDPARPAACGTAAGVPSLIAPTADLCSVGTATAVTTANGAHRWTCEGADDFSQCSAPGLSVAGGGDGIGDVVLVSLTGAGCVLAHAEVVAPPAGLPAGTVLPYGVLDFTLTGCEAGVSATLVISYSGPVGGYIFWKYLGGEWMTMPNVVLSGNTATLTIQDNGPYDADSTFGVIRDPSGPGTLHGGGPAPTPIPAMTPLSVLLLLALLSGLGWWGIQRRFSKG